MVVASIGGRVTRAFDVFFAWLPHLIGALVVLLIGYVVAKMLGGLVARVLRRAGFDRTLHAGQGGAAIQKVVSHPSALLGRLMFWAVLLGAISLAVSVLGIDALKSFVASIYSYLPNVLAAALIFLVAAAVAAAVATIVARVMGETGLGKVIATVAPILIMTIATFMILDQLKIAHNIVVITYAALLGAIALASALAFGLGGRDVAARMLEGTHASVQANKDQWKQEIAQGASRAKDEAASAKQSMAADSTETQRPRSRPTPAA